jgi:hypothetical protein
VSSATTSFSGFDVLPPSFPLNLLYAICPLVYVTLSNTVLLIILGMESWLRTELGQSFSVLLMVQMLAAAEGAASLLTAAVVVRRVWLFNAAYPAGLTNIKAATWPGDLGRINGPAEYLVGMPAAPVESSGKRVSLGDRPGDNNNNSTTTSNTKLSSPPIAITGRTVSSDSERRLAIDSASSSPNVRLADVRSHTHTPCTLRIFLCESLCLHATQWRQTILRIPLLLCFCNAVTRCIFNGCSASACSSVAKANSQTVSSLVDAIWTCISAHAPHQVHRTF